MPKYSKNESSEESCGNVFRDLGFSDEEAANLLAHTRERITLAGKRKDHRTTHPIAVFGDLPYNCFGLKS